MSLATWWQASTRLDEAVRLFFIFLGRPLWVGTYAYIGRGTTMIGKTRSKKDVS